MQLHSRLDHLITKAKKVAEENGRLQLRIGELEAELAGFKQKLASEGQKNAELSEKIKIIKLAQNIGSVSGESAEVTELKRKINEYIKEIDTCIALLND